MYAPMTVGDKVTVGRQWERTEDCHSTWPLQAEEAEGRYCHHAELQGKKVDNPPSERSSALNPSTLTLSGRLRWEFRGAQKTKLQVSFWC